MRGAPLADGDGLLPAGIIPADAGSTRGKNFSCRIMRDHPRGCGEHTVVAVPILIGAGSSPRMRGARDDHDPCIGEIRIIPADAGSTFDPPADRRPY